MKTSHIPFDLTLELRALQAAQRRARLVACCGVCLWAVILGAGLGALVVANPSCWAVGAIAGVTGLGVASLHYLLSRL